jgi:hypothetical protein
MRLDSRALQTLAWYVGWQLQRWPSREAQAFLCLTSMPVRCAMTTTVLPLSDVPRDSRATVPRRRWPSRLSTTPAAEESERKKEFLQTGYFLQDKSECPRHESNMRTRFRKPLLYPLSYGGAAGSV